MKQDLKDELIRSTPSIMTHTQLIINKYATFNIYNSTQILV